MAVVDFCWPWGANPPPTYRRFPATEIRHVVLSSSLCDICGDIKGGTGEPKPKPLKESGLIVQAKMVSSPFSLCPVLSHPMYDTFPSSTPKGMCLCRDQQAEWDCVATCGWWILSGWFLGGWKQRGFRANGGASNDGWGVGGRFTPPPEARGSKGEPSPRTTIQAYAWHSEAPKTSPADFSKNLCLFNECVKNCVIYFCFFLHFCTSSGWPP